MKGRGADRNLPNRYLSVEEEVDGDAWHPEEGDAQPLRTEFSSDRSGSLIVYNQSPDIPFDASINVYRGCEHGCSYCYARPTHEYLGHSAGLDFESRIYVKKEAPTLLESELSVTSWTPQVIAISGVTDAYQPVEKKFELTRECLKVLNRFRNPFAIVTKNRLVSRDMDILQEAHSWNGTAVYLSLTTTDESLRRVMEPRTSSLKDRLETIKSLSDAGIPVGFIMGPVIPGLTDHQIPDLVSMAADHGASFGGYILLRLPHSLKELFSTWLTRHFPDSADKVLQRIRDVRGGQLNSASFDTRFTGTGIHAENIAQLFNLACRKNNVSRKGPQLNTNAFRPPGGTQLDLFQ